jgi:hypothetical protein
LNILSIIKILFSPHSSSRATYGARLWSLILTRMKLLSNYPPNCFRVVTETLLSICLPVFLISRWNVFLPTCNLE